MYAASLTSIPLEHRLFLRNEGAVGALEVAGLHADRLCLRLGLDRLVEAHRPFLVELRLGDAMGEGRSRNNPLGEVKRFLLQSAPIDQPVEETPALAFLG